MPPWMTGYLITINILAVWMTCTDKYCARHHRWRRSERTLLTVGTLGGAAGMYICMRLIRHKTRKPKFMLTLPVCILAHAALIYCIFYR